MPFQTKLEAVSIPGGADLPFVIRVPRFFLRFRFGDRKEILRDRKYFI